MNELRKITADQMSVGFFIFRFEKGQKEKVMSEKSKDYLLKTIVAIILLVASACSIHSGEAINTILGSVCFLIGFVIMLVPYGYRWLE